MDLVGGVGGGGGGGNGRDGREGRVGTERSYRDGRWREVGRGSRVKGECREGWRRKNGEKVPPCILV